MNDESGTPFVQTEGGAENVCINGGVSWWKSEDVEIVDSVAGRTRLENWLVREITSGRNITIPGSIVKDIEIGVGMA